MKVVVTGSSGLIGRAVVRQLLEQGHSVVPLDVHPDPADGAPRTVICDLTRFDELESHFRGAEGLVHLANHPSFGRTGQARGFANNVTTTFNVLEAALAAGAQRIVNASSVQAYGILFSGMEVSRVSPPQYLPVDEDHPLLPVSPYSLSKAMSEHIVESFVRREPQIRAFSLRFTSVQSEESIARHRAMREREKSGPSDQQRPARREENRSWLGGDLLTHVHVDDAARAVRLCLETDRPGHTPLNIMRPQSRRPWSIEMFQEQYGVRPPLRRPLGPQESLFETRRAREVLGFVAELPLPEPSRELIDQIARML